MQRQSTSPDKIDIASTAIIYGNDKTRRVLHRSCLTYNEVVEVVVVKNIKILHGFKTWIYSSPPICKKRMKLLRALKTYSRLRSTFGTKLRFLSNMV